MRAVLVLLLCAGPVRASTYNLQELLKKVSSDYPGVTAGREGVEAANASLRAAQFQWLPTGDVTLFLSGSPNVKCLGAPGVGPDADRPNPDQAVREANCLRTTVVDLRTQTGSSSLYDLAPIHGLLLRLDLRVDQPLYSFGKFEAGINVAKAGVDAARANLGREQADAVWNAMRVYWGLKAARAAVATIEEGVDKIREWIDKIDEALSGKNPSRYTESDLARLKVALASAQLLLIDQQRNRDYARHALQILTADPEADIDDSDLGLMEEEGPGPLPDWQRRALRLRPELQAAVAGADIARGVRRLRIAELLPDLLFSTSLNYGFAGAMDTPQNYYFNRPNYLIASLGLVLRQPLDFGVRAARYLQAKHDERAAAARSRAQEATFATEIAKAHADYEEARGRERETAKGEKVSRGWYNSVDQNMSTGLYTDGREMVEAVQNYFLFRLRRFQAIFDANIALAWLRRTTGTPSLR